MRLAFISFLFMFVSCTNDPHLVSELFEDKKLPIEIIEKSNLIHTAIQAIHDPYVSYQFQKHL